MSKDEHPQKSKKSKWPLYLSLIVVGGLVASYFLVPAVQQFIDQAYVVLTSDDEQRIKTWVDGFGWLGPLVLILAMVVQMFLLIIPSILLMVVCILAYGPVWGSLIVLTSIFTASSIGYLLGRYIGSAFVLKLLGEKTETTIEDFIDDYGFWAVIVTRLNPFLSNDAISFVGGVLKMGYWKFIGATVLGIAPLTLFVAIMGKSTDSLKTGLLWGSLVSLAVFLGYVWYKRRKKNS